MQIVLDYNSYYNRISSDIKRLQVPFYPKRSEIRFNPQSLSPGGDDVTREQVRPNWKLWE